MSNNLLSKNHPFRASVTHEDAEIVGSQNVANTANTNSGNLENTERSSSKIKLSTKTKLLGTATLGLIITYGWIQIYDAIYPPTLKETSGRNNIKKEKVDKLSYEDVTDFEWGISDLNSAEEISKPSWFKQTFCKGVKRSFFCR